MPGWGGRESSVWRSASRTSSGHLVSCGAAMAGIRWMSIFFYVNHIYVYIYIICNMYIYDSMCIISRRSMLWCIIYMRCCNIYIYTYNRKLYKNSYVNFWRSSVLTSTAAGHWGNNPWVIFEPRRAIGALQEAHIRQSWQSHLSRNTNGIRKGLGSGSTLGWKNLVAYIYIIIYGW